MNNFERNKIIIGNIIYQKYIIDILLNKYIIQFKKKIKLDNKIYNKIYNTRNNKIIDIISNILNIFYF